MPSRKKSIPADRQTGETDDPTTSPRYVAPAVEKGLDVLELLAGSADPMSQRQIADQLGRSVPEVYRVLASLEWRGYIARGREEAYRLTMKLHELAVAYPPISRLTDAAAPILRQLAIDAGQAFHIAVLDGVEIQVVMQVDSPAPLGFRVRLGGRNAIAHSASGRVLLAFQSEKSREWITAEMTEPAHGSPDWRKFIRRVESVRSARYEFVAEESLLGLIDVSFPIVDANGIALAALTMPFVTLHSQSVSLQAAAQMTFEAARKISEGLGGALATPRFPLVDPAARSAAHVGGDVK
jgi:DNA-binding IclR family transcriptional regulator